MVSKARSKRNSGLVYGFFAMCGLSPEFFSSLTLLSVIRGRPGAVHPHHKYFLDQTTTKPEPAALPFLLPQMITARSLPGGFLEWAEERGNVPG